MHNELSFLELAAFLLVPAMAHAMPNPPPNHLMMLQKLTQELQLQVQKKKDLELEQESLQKKVITEQKTFSRLTQELWMANQSKKNFQLVQFFERPLIEEQARVQKLHQNQKSISEELQKQLSTIQKLEQKIETQKFLAKKSPRSDIIPFKKRTQKPPVFEIQKGELHWPLTPAQSIVNRGSMRLKGGTAVRSIFQGKVIFSGYLPEYGNTILIDHGHQYYSLYGDLKAISKKSEDWVQTSEILGKTTLQKGIIFEIRNKNQRLNPKDWLRKSISLRKSKHD